MTATCEDSAPGSRAHRAGAAGLLGCRGASEFQDCGRAPPGSALTPRNEVQRDGKRSLNLAPPPTPLAPLSPANFPCWQPRQTRVGKEETNREVSGATNLVGLVRFLLSLVDSFVLCSLSWQSMDLRDCLCEQHKRRDTNVGVNFITRSSGPLRPLSPPARV